MFDISLLHVVPMATDPSHTFLFCFGYFSEYLILHYLGILVRTTLPELKSIGTTLSGTGWDFWGSPVKGQHLDWVILVDFLWFCDFVLPFISHGWKAGEMTHFHQESGVLLPSQGRGISALVFNVHFLLK